MPVLLVVPLIKLHMDPNATDSTLQYDLKICMTQNQTNFAVYARLKMKTKLNIILTILQYYSFFSVFDQINIIMVSIRERDFFQNQILSYRP